MDRLGRLESFAKKARIRPDEVFIKVHMHKIDPVSLYAHPDLQPRDVAILFCLIGEMDPGSGRVNLSISALARLLNTKTSNVSLSISRLKKKLLLINRIDKNTNALYFLINPDLASVGVRHQRAMATKQFRAEWVAELADEYGGDRQKALSQLESLLIAQDEERDVNAIKAELEARDKQKEMEELINVRSPKAKKKIKEYIDTYKLERVASVTAS